MCKEACKNECGAKIGGCKSADVRIVNRTEGEVKSLATGVGVALCIGTMLPHQVEAVEEARRTFLRNPGDRATITINAPSASGKTQMHRIISDALKAYGVEVSETRVKPREYTTEIFDVVAPAKPAVTIEHVIMSGASLSMGTAPDPVERTAQPSKAVEIPIGERAVEVVRLDPSKLPREKFTGDPVPGLRFMGCTPCDGLTAQMQEAVAVCDSLAAELAMESGDQADIYAKVNKALGGNAEKQLLDLIQKVGLRNWFDGDFVVLSMADATSLERALSDSPMHPGYTDALDAAIDKARQ